MFCNLVPVGKNHRSNRNVFSLPKECEFLYSASFILYLSTSKWSLHLIKEMLEEIQYMLRWTWEMNSFVFPVLNNIEVYLLLAKKSITLFHLPLLCNQIAVFLSNYWTYLFFLTGFPFTNIHDSQDSRVREKLFL